MSIILESRSLTFAAGEIKTLGAGSYVGILDSSGPVSVELIKNNTLVGNDLSLYKGTAIDLSEEQRQARVSGSGRYAFDSVKITSATAQTVEYVLASGEYKDSRLNVIGAVEVIDGERQRVDEGRAFSAYGEVVAVAGQYSSLQIWNPAASGVNLVVSNMVVAIGTSDSFRMDFYNTELTDLKQSGRSKNDGVDSVAKIVGQTNVSFLVVTPYLRGWSGDYVEKDYKQPVVIGPGKGLLVSCATVNRTFTIAPEWHEEQI